MARFEDFTQHEKHVLREAMAWSQSEFYDPGHTQEDRATLQALIMEAKAAELAAQEVAERPTNAPEDVADKDVGNTSTEATERPTEPERATEQPTPSVREHAAIKKPTRKVAQQQMNGPAEYKGFLLIRCDQCGDTHAFCAKLPISTYRCRECGGRTPLVSMSRLMVTCECGAKHNYLTNIVTQQMDVTCFTCGAPVAVEWNEKLQRYTTIGAYAGRRRKKGGKG